MADPFFVFGSVLIVSVISLIGILTIGINEKLFSKMLLYLVSFSAGALFGGAFLHLLPELSEKFGFGFEAGLLVLAGIILFFVIEKGIHWHHCHLVTPSKSVHSFGYMNLIGDAVHNFVDGLMIGGSYIASLELGIATTVAVILHEIPQEIGDFAVLLHSGFSRNKALLFNFISALTAFGGAIAALVLGSFIGNIAFFLLPFTAGGFIYIAGSDLIPELRKCFTFKESLIQLIFMIFGISLMLLLAFF